MRIEKRLALRPDQGQDFSGASEEKMGTGYIKRTGPGMTLEGQVSFFESKRKEKRIMSGKGLATNL
jgi:hypothetical protein